ncbi:MULTISPECIES: hypothetical protein [unclassified Bartonella]
MKKVHKLAEQWRNIVVRTECDLIKEREKLKCETTCNLHLLSGCSGCL